MCKSYSEKYKKFGFNNNGFFGLSDLQIKIFNNDFYDN